MTLFYCFVLATMMIFANNVQAQTSWESVVLEDAFCEDRTNNNGDQSNIVQGGGTGNLYIKGIASGSGIRETFIKLSLNDLDNLTGADLDNAKVELRLYTARTNRDAMNNNVSVYSVSNSWSETTLTWVNSREIATAALATTAIASGKGVRVAAWTGTGTSQIGQPTDAYEASQESRFDISTYAVEQYKLGNKTVSVLLHVTNTVDNGDQQLVSKDVATTVPGYELKLPKVIVTKATAAADFTLPVIGFNNTAVQFTNTSKLATSYAWDFGDGGTSTAENPTHTYATAGTYSVSLTINGNAELVQTKSVNIYNLSNETIVGGNMETADKASWGIVGEGTFAVGGTTWGNTEPGFGTDGYLQLTEANGTGTQYYIWQAVKLNKDSRYTFSFDYASGVNWKAWCEVFIGTANPGSADYSDGNSRGTKPLAWTDNGGAGTPAKTGVYSFEYTCPADGVYFFVIKTGANGGGKFSVALDNVKLEKVLAPIAEFTALSFGFAGSSVSFTNTSLNATSYSWDFGDGSAASTEATPSHTYAAAGEYTVTLTATGSTTVSTSKTIKILGVSDETILGGSMETADRQYWGETGEASVLTGNSNDQLVWGDLSTNTHPGGYAPTGLTEGFLTVREGWSQSAAYKIFQAVNLTSGTVYDINFDYSVGAYQKAWFEVYVGTTAPTTGDYTGDHGTKLGDSLIPWTDGGASGNNTLQKFARSYTAATTGTHYFVIKWGCGYTGGDGYFNTSIDNVIFAKHIDTSVNPTDVKFNVYTNNGRIQVQSALTSNKIAVYNTSGQLILSDSFTSERYESQTLVPGLYIVNINNEIHKLSVR